MCDISMLHYSYKSSCLGTEAAIVRMLPFPSLVDLLNRRVTGCTSCFNVIILSGTAFTSYLSGVSEGEFSHYVDKIVGIILYCGIQIVNCNLWHSSF